MPCSCSILPSVIVRRDGRAAATVALAFILAPLASAALKVASPFGDHMVLQQNMPLPVWGTAEPGAVITVEFADQKKSVTTGAAGHWQVALDPLMASAEPREFAVSAAPPEFLPEARIQSQKFSDVLVGEVWLCGGQSNMERQLGLWPGQKPIVAWEAEAAGANFPQIREFFVPHATAREPREFVDSTWQVCSPETVTHFSAVGFFFARDLHRARGVPVGILHSSYGGTPAEAWMSSAGLAAFPEFAELVAQHARAMLDPEGARRDFLLKLNQWFHDHDPGTRANPPWSAVGIERESSAWQPMQLPTLWEDAGFPDWDGVAWFHRTVDLPAGWASRDLVLRLSAVDDVDTTWFNGTDVGTSTIWNQQRTYHIPAAAVKTGANEITVRVLDTGGGGGIWEPRLHLDLAPADGSSAAIPLSGPWQVRFATTLEKLPTPPQDTTAGATGVPSVLYNAMIAPFVPYAIRGVTFYQGEANAGRARQYRTLLPALIADWRRVWNQGDPSTGAGRDFPFLFVQVAPFNGLGPEIREAQLLAWQSTKNTAMVVTIDAGDAQDIHPANKRPVGERLALAARAIAYGESLEYSGPVYEKMRVDGTRVLLEFTHVDGGLVARDGEPLRGFTVLGADGVAHAATATVDGDTVVVTSAEVAQPVAVRYGWANVADGNLFNRAGLPASPFRTDVQ